MTRFAGRFTALLRLGLVAGVLSCALSAPAAGAATCSNDAHRTGASASLPECRAWEMVSPADKAHSVSVNPGRFRFTEGGSGLSPAAVFQSLGGFADPLGSGVAFDYMAQRTLTPGTQGWATHALTPNQEPLSYQFVSAGYDPLFIGEGDPLLTRMVHRTITEVAPAPNLRKLSKLYMRSDLRSPGAGSYSLLSNSLVSITPPPLATGQQIAHYAGASTDLRHVLFESVYRLTADAVAGTGQPKLYQSVDGVVRLVGVLPNGSPAQRSIAGQSAGGVRPNGTAAFTPNVISDDGSKIFFTVPQVVATGGMYMRDDQGTDDVSDDTTTQINRSESTIPDPDGPLPATYWNAATDGSRVYFTSGEALTDDAPVGNDQKLYAYDASRPDSDPDNLTYVSGDLEPADAYGEVQAVMDVSEDGRTAYFVQRGQIVPGEPPLDQELGIYAWREGEGVEFVGRMQDQDNDPRDTSPETTHPLGTQWGAQVTPDGDSLLMSLRRPPTLAGVDHGDCVVSIQTRRCAQLYLWEYGGGEPPVCVSCDPNGSIPRTMAYWSTRVGTGASAPGAHRNRAVSEDGSHVYFTTGERLVADDRNEADDVYRWDADTGRARLISTGTSADGSYFIDASADGQDVFIATREQLSPWDIDRDMDLYDARVDGGVPAPVSVQDCSGDACQGAIPPPPANVADGTSTFTEAPTRGKVTRPRASPRRRARRVTCRRGRVRRRIDGRVRCVTRARAQRLAEARRQARNDKSGRGGAR